MLFLVVLSNIYDSICFSTDILLLVEFSDCTDTEFQPVKKGAAVVFLVLLVEVIIIYVTYVTWVIFKSDSIWATTALSEERKQLFENFES